MRPFSGRRFLYTYRNINDLPKSGCRHFRLYRNVKHPFRGAELAATDFFATSIVSNGGEHARRIFLRKHSLIILQLFSAHTFFVEQKLNACRLCAYLYFYFGIITAASLPGPALHRIGAASHRVSHLDTGVVDRTDADNRLFHQSSYRGGVTAGGVWIAADVNYTRNGEYPGIGTVKGNAAVVAPSAQARFAQIIPYCPHKITQDVWILFHLFPVLADILGEGLRAKDDPLRMLLTLQ